MHKIKKKKKIHVSILRLSAPLLYAQNKKKTIQVSILRLSAPLLYQQNQKKKSTCQF